MALTPTEEAQTRALIAQEAAILSLAAEEPAIISNLGATDVSLSDLGAAASLADADLLLVRQGGTDKSISGAIVKAASTVTVPDASETVKGIVELATIAEAQTGTDTVRAVTPYGLSGSMASIEGAFKKLAISATGLSANITVTADEIAVQNTANNYKTLRAVSFTIAGTSVAANGIDAGTIAASTWYSVWVIWNGTTTAGLLSLSTTAPVLPANYTHKARVGWVRTDGTINKYPLNFVQFGRDVQYRVAAGSNVTAPPMMASGTASVAAVAVASFVPSTAGVITICLYVDASQAAYVGPNNQTTATTAGSAYTGSQASAGGPIVFVAPILLESTNIFWNSSGGNSRVSCIGWTDNI